MDNISFHINLYLNSALELTGSNFSAVDFKVFSIHSKSSFLTPHLGACDNFLIK